MTEFKESIQKLLDSDVSGYRIFKDTGISQARISDLRRGVRELGGISLDTAEKLYNYQKSLEKSDL